MKTNEALQFLADKDFLDKIYHFSYHRCHTSFEAEDLCSDILVAVLAAIHKQAYIENFYAFVWTIAHRVYADYCEKRNAGCRVCSLENMDVRLASKENEIEAWLEEEDEQEQISRIFREIAFLSRTYREVMVMFYLDARKVKEIAARLHISETAVRQRLFSARNSVRKEVETMKERTYVLKPVKLAIAGCGNPCGNDPRMKTERMFSQNLLYLCKDKPKSAKKLSEELCVPMPFIEEELEIQCCGENGRYGMLRKVGHDTYTANILVADYDEYDAANAIYEKHVEEYVGILQKNFEKQKDAVLSFPYLSRQTEARFVLWSLLSKTVWDFEGKIKNFVGQQGWQDMEMPDRPFSCAAVAYRDEQNPVFDFYGCDGIRACSVGGYKSVFVSNIYGKRMDHHFHCGHDITNDPQLLLLLQTMEGVSLHEIREEDREIAAKAMECGYICKKENLLWPKIVAFEKQHEEAFDALARSLNEGTEGIAEETAKEIAVFMKQHIPEHLLNEYPIYVSLIAGVRFLSAVIEACLQGGLLTEPENRVGAEGMLLVLEK